MITNDPRWKRLGTDTDRVWLEVIGQPAPLKFQVESSPAGLVVRTADTILLSLVDAPNPVMIVAACNGAMETALLNDPIFKRVGLLQKCAVESLTACALFRLALGSEYTMAWLKTAHPDNRTLRQVSGSDSLSRPQWENVGKLLLLHLDADDDLGLLGDIKPSPLFEFRLNRSAHAVRPTKEQLNAAALRIERWISSRLGGNLGSGVFDS